MKNKVITFVCLRQHVQKSGGRGAFNRLLADSGFTANSRGVSVSAGSAVSEKSVIAAKELGFNIEKHKPTQLTVKDIKKADLVCFMTDALREFISKIYSEYSDKFIVFETDISDPYGGTQQVYDLAAKQIFDEIKKLGDTL